MPLLRRNTIRLFEASMETLNLALVGLAAPSRIERREPGARYAPHIGLVGSALELALGACVVQVHGNRALLSNSDADVERRKSPEQILADFRDLLSERVPRSGFLTEGVDHPERHLRRLLDMSHSFGAILGWRSTGLEAGSGPRREVCVFAATRVVDFLDALGESSRVRPYLETLPRPREPMRDGRFEVELDRGSQNAMAVRLEPDNPEAIPVAPGFLQQSFSRRRDQWRADVGNANARLEQGTLDLPPRESVLTCFALGDDELRGMLGVSALKAEHVWPFIASSLSLRGTVGPYWFLVRAVEDDLDALRRHMSRAFRLIGGVTGRRRQEEFVQGLDAIVRGRTLAADDALAHELRLAVEETGEQRGQLVDNLARAEDIEREVPESFAALVRRIAQGQTNAGEALEVLSAGEHGLDQPTRQYWARVICGACLEFEDKMGLIGVLQDEELRHAHANARKALRWIDAMSFGPEVDFSSQQAAGQQVSAQRFSNNRGDGRVA